MTSKPEVGQREQPGTFKVLYFAAARSYTDKEGEALPAPLKLEKLFDVLEGRYEGFRERVLGHCKVAVNWEYLDLEEDASVVIKPGDEVGIIPPVSSG